MKKNITTKHGFTLIELSFAIAFISVLVITVTLITNEIISLYRKGYAIKTINQVGSDLIEDVVDSIQASPPAKISAFCDRYPSGSVSRTNCESNGGSFSVYQQYYTDVIITSGKQDNKKTVPLGGVFCTGKYTYIWNTGYLFGDQYRSEDGSPLSSRALRVKYKVGDTEGTAPSDFKLIKFEDPTRSTCAWNIYSTDDSIVYPSPSEYLSPRQISGESSVAYGFEIPINLNEAPVELLSKSDASLAIYDFVIFPPAQYDVTNKLFFSGSFILGTINGGVNIMTSSNYCESPNTFNSDFSYCAINKFNFGTQASGV